MKALALILLLALPSFASSLALAWDPITDPNLAGYNVYRATDRGLWQMDLLNTGGPIQATSYADSSAVVGQLYFYVVRSVAKDGTESDASNEMAIVAPVTVPDPIPAPVPVPVPTPSPTTSLTIQVDIQIAK